MSNTLVRHHKFPTHRFLVGVQPLNVSGKSFSENDFNFKFLSVH